MAAHTTSSAAHDHVAALNLSVAALDTLAAHSAHPMAANCAHSMAAHGTHAMAAHGAHTCPFSYCNAATEISFSMLANDRCLATI